MFKAFGRHPLTLLLGAGLGVVALAALLLAAIGGPVPQSATIGGGDWSLVRDDGTRVSARDFRGRYMLMFFGYTACRDVCPTTLTAVADAMRDLGVQADRIQPVFVTVDPHHDTAVVVHRFVRQFGPSIVGLTGTASEISVVERRFNIHAGAPGTAAGEAIEHDAVLLLVGPSGTYLGALPVAESGHAIAVRLQGFTRTVPG